MLLKAYQSRALGRVRTLLERLAHWRGKDDEARRIDPEFGIDWARRAWEEVVPTRPYQARKTGLGEPLPTFCLKVPTGGGKTLLATKVIDLANTCFRRRLTGLVLWIVPTGQIYEQTRRALKDRAHPYRQQLDIASARRTLVLEKTSGFSPTDVETNLCVLLLMLPSANRATKAQLRMFRDRGAFDRFFPLDEPGHAALIERVPNLDTFAGGGGFWRRQAQTSLGNTLRLLRPLVILDEGHKAYSPQAQATLAGFNPCLIIELSATPPPEANVLVDIAGQELLAEEMIKLDLHIRSSASTSWQDTLLAAVEHRQRLEDEARRHEAKTSVQIRPICLIQVERTGRDQRGAGLVHADDVREYLLQRGDILPEHIAVKTSQKDELKAVDDAGGLLRRDCGIRFIITKQALAEGWDCAFAYVLAILTNPGSKTGLTQLVGRILRQPYARKTGVAWLDESYVFCFRRRGADLLKEIQRGFRLEGLRDVGDRIVSGEYWQRQPGDTVTLRPRSRFRKAARTLVLPAFMVVDDGHWRPVRYEADILSRLAWDDVDVEPLLDLRIPEHAASGLDMRTGLEGERLESAFRAPSAAADPPAVDHVFAAYHLREVMPNAWRGSALTRRVFGVLEARHRPERVAGNFVYIIEEIRRRLEDERDRLARGVFHALLDDETLRFLVVADHLADDPLRDTAFTRLPGSLESAPGRLANRDDGAPLQRNLFDPLYESDLNGLEQQVATFLDRQERLYFWYRNRPRQDYYVQGWKRGRIYADFIFTLKPDAPDGDAPFRQVFVVETKGLHLEHFGDTAYKRSVFDVCSERAERRDWADVAPAMRRAPMRFEVVDEREWEQRLQALIAGADGAA